MTKDFYKYMIEKEDDINIDNEEVGSGKAKSFSKVSAKKSKKYKIPVSSKDGKFGKFVKTVLLNMINTSKGQEKGSLLLKGDPGSGKTSSLQQFADIIGMKIITIEAPHVSEDAIISVPYLVKTGMNTEKKTMEMKEDKNAAMGFEVITAESSLITDLKNKKPMKQAEWDKAVNKYAHIAKIREDYRKPIDKIRGTYNTILFLDEFYRTNSKRIQNLFRTILNGYLGDCWSYDQIIEVEIEDEGFRNFIKNEKKIKIGDLFKYYEEYYNTSIEVEDVKGINIQGENVKALVKKKNKETKKITLSNGEVLYTSIDHKFMIKDKEVFVRDCGVNTYLTDDVYIKGIEDYKIEDVYDFSLEREDELYNLGGVVHHNTPIPKNIYIIFASNMDNTDGSLDEVPLNHQFSAVNFDTPNKEDFMAYIGSKFAGAEGHESEAVVKPEVFNKFMEILDSEDMGGKDEETGIRVSPRRWEEIIKYVSNGIPPKNLKDAEALVQFVYTNMRDYKEGTQSSKTEKYAQLVRDLVKENSEFDVSHVSAPKGTDWENLFESQIRAKMALGSDRKYVASLAGKPGVGKTSTMRRLAKDMGAKLIEIDCATLNSEDVVGLTTPNKNENGVMQTKFTAPPLWSKIMDQYDPTISIPGSSYTHILFLDEITRASKRVMNSIRSLMLEKKVNANYAIPDDMMIVTAMNPTDTGTEELSDHLADVMDIIDVEVKDSELYKYLKSKDSNKEANDVLGFDITTRVINIFRELINKLESDEDTFGEPISGGSKKWYWQWEGNVIYVSPRELDDMISGSIGQGIAELVDFNDYDRSKNYTDDEYLEFQDIIKNNIIDKTCELLSFIGEDKHNIDKPGMQYLYDYIKYQIETEDFDEIMDVQSQNISSIKSMVEESDYDFDGMLEYDEMGDVIASYVESVEPEEVTANVSDVIDVIVNDYADTPTQFIDNIIGFYKVMSTCDWNEYSGKISANLTQAFLQRGLKSYAKALLKSAITSNRSYTPEIDSHKYFSILEDLAGRKNYFK